jgi:BlaI family transcriptional regulator, penicillinase repressor
MDAKNRPLTEQELEIMKVIWETGPATVRDVYEKLLERRTLAYTTVMTMMNILEGKGHLVRRPEGRAYVYEPAQGKGQVLSSMVSEFVERVFDGAAEPLVLSLVRDRKLSKKELQEIARMIDELPEDER